MPAAAGPRSTPRATVLAVAVGPISPEPSSVDARCRQNAEKSRYLPEWDPFHDWARRGALSASSPHRAFVASAMAAGDVRVLPSISRPAPPARVAAWIGSSTSRVVTAAPRRPALLSLRYGPARRTEQQVGRLYSWRARGNAECARLLLAAGARAELVSANGTSPLPGVPVRGHPERACCCSVARADQDVADGAGSRNAARRELLRRRRVREAAARARRGRRARHRRRPDAGRPRRLRCQRRGRSGGQILELLRPAAAARRRSRRLPPTLRAAPKPCLQTTGRAGCPRRLSLAPAIVAAAAGRRRRAARSTVQRPRCTWPRSRGTRRRWSGCWRRARPPTIRRSPPTRRRSIWRARRGRLAAVALLLERGASPGCARSARRHAAPRRRATPRGRPPPRRRRRRRAPRGGRPPDPCGGVGR